MLSAFGILFPSDLGIHVLQTPLMWAHYQDFIAEHEEIPFTQFLDFHTSEEAHEHPSHDEQEEEIPCHHHHALHTSAFFVFHFEESACLSQSTFISEAEVQFGEEVCNTLVPTHSSVWNPPRFS